MRALKAAKSGDVILVPDLQRLCRSQDLAPLLSRLGGLICDVIGTKRIVGRQHSGDGMCQRDLIASEALSAHAIQGLG